MGGNGAIETVADFMNSLLDIRNSRENGLQELATHEITILFTKVQDARNIRATEIIKNAHEMQALFALENPIASRLALQYMGSKLAPKDILLKQLAGPVISGTKVKQLPVPLRPRAMPFDHELPGRSMTLKRAAWQRILWTAYTILLLLLSIRVTSMIFDRPSDIRDWDSFLQRAWTGRTAIYEGLDKAASATFHTTSGSHSLPRVRLMYLMSQLISPLLIYTIEGYRPSNFGTIISFPSLFTGGMLLCGLSGVAPIHAILSSWNSFTTPVDRFVPIGVVKTLVPALTAGYILPTIMICVLPADSHSREASSGFWQFPPLLFSAFTATTSFVVSWWQRKKQSTAESKESLQLELERYQHRDVPILKSVYEYAFAIQATAHIATLTYSSSLGLPFFSLDFTLPYAFNSDWTLGTSLNADASFQLDIILAGLSILGYNLYAVWDLRRAGYIRTNRAVEAFLAIMIGNFVFGPGATWAGLWTWRESVIADLSKAK
jgi:hypothetical protein